MRPLTAVEGLAPMIPLNTQLGLPSRAFWYVALRSLVVAVLVVLLGSVVKLVSALPGATCNGHACNPASGAHLAAFVYLFAALLVMLAALNFKWFSFVLTDRNITINSGVIQRTSSTIRFDRIQDVNVSRDPLQALLGLKSISIWTASPEQRVGNSRRPDGRIVLAADDADWLREYLSDPPAAAAATGAGRVTTVVDGPGAGNGAVTVAALVVAALVVLAAMAALQRSAPMPAQQVARAAPVAPAYAMKRGTDGRMHPHAVRGVPGLVVPAPGATAAAAAAPPRVAAVQPASDYRVACAIEPQRATPAVRSCADLAIAERCDHETDFASRPTAEPATVTVVNQSDQSVKFYWLNQSGNRALYATLPPGGRLDQPSHSGAHWLLANADGQCLGVLDAATMKVGIF